MMAMTTRSRRIQQLDAISDDELENMNLDSDDAATPTQQQVFMDWVIPA